jgi:AraC-like DNA-binding protein
MLLFLSILGIFLSLILLFFNARDNKSTIYLGLFFFLLSLYAFYQYVLLYSKSVTLVSIFLVNVAVFSSPLYLIGPLLYWYIRSVLTDNAKLKTSDFWHFIPMIIFFVAALPHAFVPWQEKVAAARAVVENADFMESYRVTLLSKVYSPVVEYLTRPLLVVGYTFWSLGLFVNYLVKKKVSGVLSKQHFMKKWLCLLLGLLLMLEVNQIILIMKGFEMHFSELYFTLNILRIFSAAGLIGLMISLFFFPTILYGLPRVPESEVSLTTNNEGRQLMIEEEKKHPFHFESDYVQCINQKADFCMKEHKPYLQPDCNLAYFSKLLNIPTHHLAYYFREIKKQTFNDYRNEWRIKHAKQLMEEGKASEITLEAIGTLSGFSSRNAFINDFKKMEGISPGAYASSLN